VHLIQDEHKLFLFARKIIAGA